MDKNFGKLLCPNHYQQKIQESSLFKNSLIERLQAYSISWMTSIGRKWIQPAESQVVPRLTLWERFLSVRSRESRSMTFSVAFKEQVVHQTHYILPALCEVVRTIIEYKNGWQNQPLNVTVRDSGTMRLLDPRESTRQFLRIAIINEDQTYDVYEINLKTAAELDEAEFEDHITQQLNCKVTTDSPVSIVFDQAATHADHLAEKYTEHPGAWLRFAPEEATGGLAATADHLVMDGLMFQNMLLRVAKACAIRTVHNSNARRAALESETLQHPLASIRIENLGSLTELLGQVVETLEEFGVQLKSGRDSIQLVTIPCEGPDTDDAIEKRKRRVLPLMCNMENINSPNDMRQRIQQLNQHGWCSLGALVWERLYRRDVQKWLIQLLECMGECIPCINAVNYLKGSAVVSCIPVANVANVCSRTVSHLTSLSMRPCCSGPLISLIQIPDTLTGTKTGFITLSGSGSWDNMEMLENFKQALNEKISASLPITKRTA